jgi:hypothetical protein
LELCEGKTVGVREKIHIIQEKKEIMKQGGDREREKEALKSLSTWITLFNDNRRWKFHSQSTAAYRALCIDLKLIGNLMSEEQHRKKGKRNGHLWKLFESLVNIPSTISPLSFRLICNWNFIGRNKESESKKRREGRNWREKGSVSREHSCISSEE